MKNKLFIATGAVALVIGASACTVGNGNGPDLGNSNSNDKVAAKWNQIRMGMTRDQVTGILGTPDSSDHSEVEGMTEDCIYYGTFSYQFCFTNGSLDTKNQY